MRFNYVLFFGSEFSRHPEGLSFSGLGSKFSRSEFSRHPNSLGEIFTISL